MIIKAAIHVERILSEKTSKEFLQALLQCLISIIYTFLSNILFWRPNLKNIRLKMKEHLKYYLAFVCVVLAEQMKIKTVFDKDRRNFEYLFGWNKSETMD